MLLSNGCFLYFNVKHLFTRWQQQTSDRIGMGLLFLYAMQVFTLGVYYTSDASLEEVEVRQGGQTASEVPLAASIWCSDAYLGVLLL